MENLKIEFKEHELGKHQGTNFMSWYRFQIALKCEGTLRDDEEIQSVTVDKGGFSITIKKV